MAAAGSSGAAPVLAIGGSGSRVVAVDAVRGRVQVALAQEEGRAAGRDAAVAPAHWRPAVLVAMALAEAAARDELGEARSGGRAPWELALDVPAEPLELVRRTGLPRDAVRAALERLVAARVLEAHHRAGHAWRVQLAAEVFEDAPVVGAVAWEAVRRALPREQLPAALLLVRELAAQMTPADRELQRVLRVRPRELAEAIGYSRGKAGAVLDALAAAGLAAVDRRPRDRTLVRLTPAVFDAVGGAPSGAARPGSEPLPAPLAAASAPRRVERTAAAVVERDVRDARVAAPVLAPPAGPPSASTAAPAPAPAPASGMRRLELWPGAPVEVPAGAPLRLTTDAAGELVADVQLGARWVRVTRDGLILASEG